MNSSVDVAVVGGGAAGLAAAVALARSLRSVVVVDAGEPRNAPAAHALDVLGREGTGPLDLLAAGRAEAAGYGVDFRADRVVTARREGAGFHLELLAGPPVRARRLLLATGLVDELPDVPGLRALWGTGVLHCPFCHGYEVRGQHVGVLGVRASSLHQVLLFRALTDRVTFFRQDLELPAGTVAQFRALGVEVVEGTVRGVGGEPGAVAVDVGSRPVEVEAPVVAPWFRARGEVFAQLGGELATNAMGEFVPVQPGGATSVPGVWAAGNVADVATGPAWLVGNSMGGGLALDASVTAPDLVAGLVLLAPAVSGAPDPVEDDPRTLDLDARADAAAEAGDLETAVELDAQLWLDGPTSVPGRVGGTARELFRAMDGVAHRNRAFLAGHGGGDAWSRLGELDLPVVLATGDLDCGYLQYRTEELLARIPGARRADLPGVAHLPSLERPDLVRAVVDDAVRTS